MTALLLAWALAVPALVLASDAPGAEQAAAAGSDWQEPAAYALVAGLLAAFGVGFVLRRRLVLEAGYSKRLEKEVRRRTQELAQSNEELKNLNDKLLEASLTDPLTGLRNRRFLFEEVGKHVELIRRWHDDHDADEDEALNIVFLMVDLDHFKPVNDRCGHAAGDQMLRSVRDVLLRVCRSSDFVVRWGGDEFIVISRNARSDQVEALAERIRSEIGREVFRLDNAQVVRTTCSIGFASYPFLAGRPELLNWEQTLGLADSALFMAKRHRNAWVGYLGTEASPGHERLFHAIRSDAFEVEDQGALEIRASAALRENPAASAAR